MEVARPFGLGLANSGTCGNMDVGPKTASVEGELATSLHQLGLGGLGTTNVVFGLHCEFVTPSEQEVCFFWNDGESLALAIAVGPAKGIRHAGGHANSIHPV